MIKHLEMSLVQAWYQGKPQLGLLRPFSLSFTGLVRLRKKWYQWVKPAQSPVPVIVVGNISVGGSGKTPVVIALAQALKSHGYNPAIISRGYGGHKSKRPTLVEAHHTAQEVGDEPKLIAHLTQVPVMVGANRVASVSALTQLDSAIDVIISDDGLQHYKLDRFKEIAMVDSTSLGNQRLLPEGPLREPVSRLKEVDYCLGSGPFAQHEVLFNADQFYWLNDLTLRPLAELAHQQVHAVAAIARPERFFASLKRHRLNIREHPKPDHNILTEKDLAFGDELPILMTEKDAIKCPQSKNRIGVVCLRATLPQTFIDSLVKDLNHGQKTT